MTAAGISKRFFHLAEDLRLAQHQRIEAAGDAHQMADGVIILMPVKAFSQVFFVEAVVVAQPADQRFLQVILLFYAEIQLCAVTRRQHYPALHHWLRKQAVQRLIERIRRKRYAFSQRYRCRFMVNTKR